MENKNNFFENYYNEKDYVNQTQIHKGKVIHNYTYQVGSLAMQEQEKIDAYFTPNTLFPNNGKFERIQSNVSRLKFLYADIDCYNVNMTPEAVLYELEQDYFNCSIPCPNLAIHSGRGMYLLWFIDEHAKALPRWKRCQRGIFEKLKDFGADPKVVTDSVRLLRMIGSINSKTGRKVSVLREYNQEKQTLYHIENEFLSYEKPENKAEKREIKTHGKLAFFSDEKALLQTRLADLETLLLKHRDYEGSGRENILFLYRYWTLSINGQNEEEALDATLKLNARMNYPLSKREVIKATKSAEKAYRHGEGKYKYKNSTLISQLQITEEEMQDMRSLKSPELIKERQRTRSRRAYLRRLEMQGKDTKSNTIRDRRSTVKHLYGQGMSQSEIAEKVSVSCKTIQRDIAYLTKEGQLENIVNFSNYSKKNENKIIEKSRQARSRRAYLESPKTEKKENGKKKDFSKKKETNHQIATPKKGGQKFNACINVHSTRMSSAGQTPSVSELSVYADDAGAG